MGVQQRASSADISGVGIALLFIGGYFILVALGVLPEPSDTTAHAPSAIVIAAGAAFVFAGLNCMVRAKAGVPDNESEMPDDAPRWIQLSYRAFAVGMAGAMAAIGTWIALGSGPRAFSITGFAEMRTTGELIGRTVFGLGAVIVWIYVIGVTVTTVRKFFNPPG